MENIEKGFMYRLTNLLSIKSLVTLISTFVFAYLSLSGIIDSEKFMTVFTLIVGFYFGTQKVSE